MANGLEIVDGLLDVIEGGENGAPFIGPVVSAAVHKSRYRYLWRPLIERYGEMSTGDGALRAAQLYCDIACTVITKKVMMVDMDYLYESRPDEDEEITRLREAHTVMARRYLVKMLNCIYECVHGRPPNGVDTTNAVLLLYAEVYAEAFDPVTVREHDVFALVQKWFGAYVKRPAIGESYRDVAPGGPFLHCSHVYWLWLHLTAARVRYGAQDLVTVVYALDTIVYCNACRTHLLELIPEYFVNATENGLADCFCRHPNDMLLFHVHNRVNATTGSPVMDEAVLDDYRRFWNGQTLSNS